MQTYKTTIVAIAVHRKDERPIYGESTTIVRLEDEGGGPFISLNQCKIDGTQTIRLDMAELKAVYYTAKGMMKDIGEQ